MIEPCCNENHPRKKKIQQSEWDENLFESFLQALQTSRGSSTSFSPVSDSSSTRSGRVICKPKHRKSPDKWIHLSHSDKRNLYVEVLFTIKHKIGSSASNHNLFAQELQEYAKRVFDISEPEHRSLLIAASEEKPPIVMVNVCVIQARGLEAKDADGFSDPYVMLGIVPGIWLSADKTHQDESNCTNSNSKSPSRSGATSPSKSPLGIRRFGRSIRKKVGGSEKYLSVKQCGSNYGNSSGSSSLNKDNIPARFIQTTSVKSNSLDPVWNELFHFDIDSCERDLLHLDIWDHDDEENVFDAVKRLNEVKGVKGLSRFFKQVGQSARNTSGDVDDFLGCTTVELKDIPSMGIRKWYQLEGRNSKCRAQGEIELDIKLSTREHRNAVDDDNWLDILQHKDLVKIFVAYELIDYSNYQRWDGVLRQEAETILHQHAIQGDMTELQVLLCRWLAFSELYFLHNVPDSCLVRLLAEMEKCYKPGSLSRDEINLLSSSYCTFLNQSLDKLKMFRDEFPIEDSMSLTELRDLLKIHKLMGNSKLYRSTNPFENELSTRIYKSLKNSASDLVAKQFDKMGEKSTDNYENGPLPLITQYLTAIEQLNADLTLIEENYQDIFMREYQIDLFQITYKVYGKEVHNRMFNETGLYSLDQQYGTVLFRDFDSFDCFRAFIKFFAIFANIQQFYSYQDYLVIEGDDSFEPIDHQQWFGIIFDKWIKYIKHVMSKKIDHQIENDSLNAVIDSIYSCSTSAVNFVGCIDNIVQIWRRMQWSSISGKMAYVTSLTEAIGGCGLLYADALHEKVRLAGYFDECGQFDLSSQLCITLNNVNRVENYLDKLSYSLGFDQLAAEVAASSGEKKAGKSILESLNFIAKQNREHIAGVTFNIIHRVAGKMRPEIRKNVFHLCWSPPSVIVEKAASDLLLYLNQNVTLIRRQTHQEIFTRMLEAIWSEMLTQVQEQATKEFCDDNADSDDSNNDKIFVISRLYQCLSIVRNFFLKADDNVTPAMLDTERFKNLQYLLSLYQLSPRDIIECYFKEKQEQQEAAPTDSEYGTLTIRIFFKRSSGVICLDIIKANGLMPLDSNGLSDPFVIIELMPSHYFSPSIKPIRTKVVKNSLDPVFNEFYEMPVRLDQISKSGSSLVLTVMDHDMLMTDDLEGVVIINLNDIEGIDTEINNHSSVKTTTFPLIMPKYEGNKALSVLEYHKNDSYANEILKKWSNIEKNAMKD